MTNEESKRDVKEIQKEVREKLKEFEKTRTAVSVDELIAEDKQDFKNLINNQETLKEMVVELLQTAKEYANENDKLRRYMQEEKNALVAQYYKQKLIQSGMIRRD